MEKLFFDIVGFFVSLIISIIGAMLGAVFGGAIIGAFIMTIMVSTKWREIIKDPAIIDDVFISQYDMVESIAPWFWTAAFLYALWETAPPVFKEVFGFIRSRYLEKGD